MSETRAVAWPAPVPGTGVPAAVLLATVAGETGPAALQALDGATLLRRAAQQLATLGVGAFRVVTRPAWEHDVAGALDGLPAHVVSSPDAGEDLRLVADTARDGAGVLIVAQADIVTQTGALASLVDDSRVATGVLVARRLAGRRYAPRVRERRGRVVSASSPYHAVRRPTGAFAGVLKVAPGDRAALAAVAERLAALRAAVPAPWQELFDHRWERRKAGAENEAETRRHRAAAQEDVASLLVTGLVREGVNVTSRHLNRLFWARPLSPEAVATAAEQLHRQDADRVLLNSAVKSNDGFFTTYFVSPYSRFIARWAARRGLTPNQVTTASLIVGVAAAAAFATGERWGLIAGAVLLQVAFTLDCVDGQLARYTRTFSSLGAWLDSIFDRAKEYLVYAGLAIGAARVGESVWLLAGCALALQTVRHMIYVSYKDSKPPFVPPAQPPIEQPSDRLGAGPVLEAADDEDEVDDAPPPPPPETAGRSLSKRTLRLWHRVESRDLGAWPRKVIAFPIGERFAAISLTAAIFTPRVTFVVLLAWGGVAAVYTFAGRVLRSTAWTAAGTASELALYRDDGPLARALGRAVGVGVDQVALVVAGTLPLVAAIAIGGDGASDAVAGGAIAWAILCGGVSIGGRHGRLRWAQLPLLRTCEYAGLLWLAALAGPSALPAAFALLAAIAYRHYDLVYRVRLRGAAPPAWVNALSLGWEVRLLGAYVLLVAGALTAGYFAAAAVFAVAFAGESIAAWASEGRGPQPLEYEDEEDEDL